MNIDFMHRCMRTLSNWPTQKMLATMIPTTTCRATHLDQHNLYNICKDFCPRSFKQPDSKLQLHGRCQIMCSQAQKSDLHGLTRYVYHCEKTLFPSMMLTKMMHMEVAKRTACAPRMPARSTIAPPVSSCQLSIQLHCRYPAVTQTKCACIRLEWEGATQTAYKVMAEGRSSSTALLENKEYRTGRSLDHQAKVLFGISSFVWRPYRYRVYDRGTTAPQSVSVWSW